MDDKQQTFVGLLSGSTVERVDFLLSDDTRAGIVRALGRPSTDPPVRMFLDALQTELGTYAVLEKQRQDQATWKQRVATLNKLSTTTQELMGQLAGLDGLSYQILQSLICSTKGISGPIVHTAGNDLDAPAVSFPRPLEELHQDLQLLLMCLEPMRASFNSNLKPGARLKQARRDLIDAIIRSYHSSFEEWPSSTAEGAIECVAALCLKAVGVVISDVHSEIVTSLARVRGK